MNQKMLLIRRMRNRMYKRSVVVEKLRNCLQKFQQSEFVVSEEDELDQVLATIPESQVIRRNYFSFTFIFLFS